VSVNDPTDPDPNELAEQVLAAIREYPEAEQQRLYGLLLQHWESLVKQTRALLKPDVEADMRPGDNLVSHIEFPPGSGRRLSPGYVQATDPQDEVVVLDNELFLDWGQVFYPTEVVEDSYTIPEQVIPAQEVYTRELRPAFWKKFTVQQGKLHGPNGETDIPGLGITRAAPMQVSFHADHRVINTLWQALKTIVPASIDAPPATPTPPITIVDEEPS
jgi:hypothetical protein